MTSPPVKWKRQVLVRVPGSAVLKNPYTSRYGARTGSACLAPTPTPLRHLRGLLGLLFTAKKGT